MLAAPPKSHVRAGVMVGRRIRPLGSGPIYAPPPVPGRPGSAPPHHTMHTGTGGVVVQKRPTRWPLGSPVKHEADTMPGGRSRKDRPSKAGDAPACAGKSDLRAGRALTLGCQPETTVNPGHLPPGPQSCSHSLGGPGGGESHTTSAHPSPRAVSGTLGGKARQWQQATQPAWGAGWDAHQRSLTPPHLRVLPGCTNKWLIDSRFGMRVSPA